jgi:hypothetical protein
MTIAACFLTPGGVVLGADSTTTISVVAHGGVAIPHYFEHAQKMFEIGHESTLGVVTWGLGAFADVSYRTLFAELGDRVAAGGFSSVRKVVDGFASSFWTRYAKVFSAELRRVQDLNQKGSLNDHEQQELATLLQQLTAGFCIGGYLLPDRTPRAFELNFSPDQASPPAARELAIGQPQFWGVPNIVNRVIFGIDSALGAAIVRSSHWSGTDRDLLDLIEPFVLRLAANLPIREAIDYVHSVILTTCKGLKFSHLPPVCGGPVEVAVITTDRRFRWVTHKTLGEALP